VRVLLDVSAVPDDPVGAGVYTLALARGLALHTVVDLHLVSRHGDHERWTRHAPDSTVHDVAPVGRPQRLAWEQSFAPRVAQRVNADVWHGPHYTMPLRLGMPAVVTVHDLTFFDHPEWHERSKVVFFRRMIRASARRAAAVICVSEYTASRLRAVAPATGSVTVIPHGVDHERFRPETDGDHERDATLLREYGVVEPFVVFVGTLEPRKNVPALVSAFARVARTHPDLRLVLAGGDGWGAEAVRAEVARSRVATRVIRTGYVGDDVVDACYRQAEVVVYPSLEEGFGLPALEALACAAPLVTTAGSALEEVAGDAAITVPAGDATALTTALETVLDAPDVAARLRAAGPARAAQFTWERAVDAHVAVYHALAGERARP
jgi:glycosyltransferase involved in cell wall biosynthesis